MSTHDGQGEYVRPVEMAELITDIMAMQGPRCPKETPLVVKETLVPRAMGLDRHRRRVTPVSSNIVSHVQRRTAAYTVIAIC
jgi:hypothetical protein